MKVALQAPTPPTTTERAIAGGRNTKTQLEIMALGTLTHSVGMMLGHAGLKMFRSSDGLADAAVRGLIGGAAASVYNVVADLNGRMVYDVIGRGTIQRAGRVFGPILEMTSLPYAIFAASVGFQVAPHLGLVREETLLSELTAGLLGTGMIVTAICLGLRG